MGSHRPLRVRLPGKPINVVGARRTPEQTAKLIILTIEAYARQRNKDVSRVTMTNMTLARLASSFALSSQYMTELEDCLAEFGWQMFETFVGTKPRYAFIRLDTTEWVCISDVVLFENQGGAHKASKEHVAVLLAEFGERGFIEDAEMFDGD